MLENDVVLGAVVPQGNGYFLAFVKKDTEAVQVRRRSLSRQAQRCCSGTRRMPSGGVVAAEPVRPLSARRRKPIADRELACRPPSPTPHALEQVLAELDDQLFDLVL